jgi:hypothetical protein
VLANIFISVVDCCFAGQIADFGQNGPNMASHHDSEPGYLVFD